MKTSCKLSLFSDTESAHEGTSSSAINPFDPASTEVLIELGRGLYKLMFQLLLLIEADHKIAASVINNLQQNDRMQDMTRSFISVRSALLRCIDDAELDALDTSTSTEGEITPTPSPLPPMDNTEFENLLFELIDGQKWSAAIAHVRQHKKLTSVSSLNFNLLLGATTLLGVSTDGEHVTDGTSADDLSFILNIYAQRLIKDTSGTKYIADFKLAFVYLNLIFRYFHCITLRSRTDRNAYNPYGECIPCVRCTNQYGDVS